MKLCSPALIGGAVPTAKKRLVSAEGLIKLEEAINRVVGGGLPPGWDMEAANLTTDYDWILLQAAFLLNTRLPPAPKAS